MDTNHRIRMIKNGEKESVLPITFEGVAEGYYELASRYFEDDIVESARCMEKALHVLYKRRADNSWILDATVWLANAWIRVGTQERARLVCQETREYFLTTGFIEGANQADALIRHLSENI